MHGNLRQSERCKALEGEKVAAAKAAAERLKAAEEAKAAAGLQVRSPHS